MRLDQLTATGSTIQTDEESFHAVAADYAKSIQRSRQAERRRHEAQRLRQYLSRKARLVDWLRDVLGHQKSQARPVQSVIVARVQCCRRIRDSSCPRSQLR